jgi:hypothetical protein
MNIFHSEKGLGMKRRVRLKADEEADALLRFRPLR